LLDEIALNNQDETARMETGEESTNKSRRLRCLNLWIWITKALVLREHSAWAFYSNKLIEWLDDPELCENSSRSFDLILNENQSVMDYKPAAIIKLFYKQRFFNSVYEKLKEKFESKDERSIKQKPYYMKSVLNMIVHLPKDLIQKQIKSVNIDLSLLCF
jgi:DNA repair/transcription protein MET18/MMS19